MHVRAPGARGSCVSELSGGVDGDYVGGAGGNIGWGGLGVGVGGGKRGGGGEGLREWRGVASRM